MVRVLIRRALFYGFPIAAFAVILLPPAGTLWRMTGSFTLGVFVTLLVTRSRVERERVQIEDMHTALDEREVWLDDREALMPSATFGTPERDLDDDGWPTLLAPRLTDAVSHPVEPLELPEPAVGVARVYWIENTDPEAEPANWYRNEFGPMWRRALDWFDTTPRLDWFFDLVDRLAAWLAAHEPSFGWTKRRSVHALDLAPAGAPVVEVAKATRVFRFVEVEPDEDVDPIRLTYDFGTKEWAVVDEWLEDDAAVGAGAP